MTKVSSQTVSFTDTLREEQQEGFPLLSEVTKGFVEDPLALMRTMDDEDGITVPCALPDSMWQSLPKMIRDVLALYEDPDIRTMLLMGAMATIGSALSIVVCVLHHRADIDYVFTPTHRGEESTQAHPKHQRPRIPHGAARPVYHQKGM